MASNMENIEMARMIETLNRKVYEMEQKLDEKDIKINWLTTRNENLEDKFDEMNKLHDIRTDIFFDAVNNSNRSNKIIEELNKEVKLLRAEKNEEELRKRHERNSGQNIKRQQVRFMEHLVKTGQQKFEKNAQKKFAETGEKVIKNIFRSNLAVLPPPHVMDQIISEIHQNFFDDQGSSGNQHQDGRNPVESEGSNRCSTSSSSQTSPVHNRTNVLPPPHILEQKMANSHQNSSPIPESQGFTGIRPVKSPSSSQASSGEIDDIEEYQFV